MNDDQCWVSVIIPTYNRAELVREALESVFSQTFGNFEVIVVDNGSTDHTREVLAQFADRIRTVLTDRSSIGSARNEGIQRARGEYLAFLDNDDLWKPEKLERHLKFAQDHRECVLTYTDAIQFSKQGEYPKSFVERFPALCNPADIFGPMITEYAIPLTSTILVKTSFLRKTGLLFPVEVGTIEDLDLFLRILMSGGKFAYLPERLTMRRLHESNFSSDNGRRFRQRKILYSDLLHKPPCDYSPERRAALEAGLRDATYRAAESDWEECNFALARHGFFESLAFDKRGAWALAYGILTYLPSAWIASLRKYT
jgi:glycosyltransferase involved in cell wall biosynthesis